MMNWKELDRNVMASEGIILPFTLNDAGNTKKTLVSIPGFTLIIQTEYILNKHHHFTTASRDMMAMIR
jgi:hypothetical protein